MEDHGLTGEAEVTIGDQPGGDLQGAAGLSETGTADQKVLDQLIVDGAMNPVVDAEGTARETGPAVATLEPGDRTDDLGVAETPTDEPRGGRIWYFEVGGTVTIGAEGGNELHG
jgi:hypothetical protein